MNWTFFLHPFLSSPIEKMKYVMSSIHPVYWKAWQFPVFKLCLSVKSRNRFKKKKRGWDSHLNKSPAAKILRKAPQIARISIKFQELTTLWISIVLLKSMESHWFCSSWESLSLFVLQIIYSLIKNLLLCQH